MKKIFIFAAVAMGMGLVSCDKVDLPNPPAQSNPQDAIFQKDDVELGAVPADQENPVVYNLTDYQNAQELVPLAVVLKSENIPSMCELKFSGRVSAGDSFTGAEFPCEVVDDMVMVDPDVFNGAVRTVSKNPVKQDVNVQFYPYIQSTVNAGYVAQIDAAYGPFPISVLPFAPENVIEEAYYLMTSTDGSTWSEGIKANHSATNVYDDPTFVFIYDGPAVNDMEPLFWKIVPQSQYPDGATWYAPIFDDAFKAKGKLEVSTDYGMNIEVAGSQVMTVNFETLEYSYTQGFTQLYTPGNSNGWNAPASQILTTTDYTDYAGYVYLNGDFKFNPDTSWAGRDFGCTDAFVYDGSPLVGTGLADGSGNINVPETGAYYVELNYPTRNTKLTIIETYGLIGSATAGGWDASTALTPSADFLTWTGEVTLSDGEFKFRANNGWDINLGGDLFNLTAGGANIASPGAGTYTVTLDLSQVPYSATLVKK